MASKATYCNCEKTDNHPFTKNRQGATLETVPDATNTRHDSKQIEGGKVTDTQPPTMCGIFLSAAQPGDSTSLPGVRGISRTSGNTRGASFDALRDTGQPLGCQNSKQSKRNAK